MPQFMQSAQQSAPTAPRQAMNFLIKGVFGLVAFFVAFNVLRNVFYDAYAVRWYRPSAQNTAGRRVLVTGSSRGIGEALAHVYSELGAHVTLHARSLNSLEKVKSECLKRGASSVHAIAADMSVPGAASRLIAESAAAMGGLDIVILNHVNPTDFDNLLKAAPESASGQLKAMQTNFFSYVEAGKAALPHLEETEGSLVIISSAAARLPVAYCYEYCFSKRALEGFFTALRQELALNSSRVHAGLAVLGSIGTEKALKAFPRYYKAGLTHSSPVDTAWHIAAIPVGRLRELATPWVLRVPLLLSGWAPEHMERHLQAISNVL